MASSFIEEVKTIIRGLLVSSPEEVTVLKLRRDYKAQEGQDIPFFEFGFHDVTTFLRSMPDVCKINNNTSGPYAIVKLVESVKSAHVSSLVLRQKTTVKGRRRHSYVPNQGRQSRYIFTPAFNSLKNKSGPLRREVKKNGYLPKTEFNFSDYKETSNKNNELPELPVFNSVHHSSNGSNNVETWLCGNEEASAVQEIYPCTPSANGSEFVDVEAIVDHHLHEILISDEGLLLKDVEEYLKDVLSTYETKPGNFNEFNLEQILRKIPYVRIQDNYIYHEQFLNTECEELPEESYKSENPEVEIKGSLEVESSKICEKGELRAHASPFIPLGVNEKVKRLEQNLNSLMKDHIHGILGSELKEKYKMKFAAPLNFQILGCETTQDLALKMPHIFSYIPLEKGDFKLFPNGYPMDRTLKDSSSKKVINIPEITKRNLQWLMQGYPNGLNSKDFEQTYKDTYLESLEIKQMGLSSFEEFLQSVEELNLINIEVTDSDSWLFPSNNAAYLTLFENPLPCKEIIENELDMKKFKEQFPRDVVGPDLHVKQVEIPSWINKASLIEIFVQEVNNPHHFWITFCGDQYSRALNLLMDDLQAFYCSKSHSYRMPPEFIREGQDCVTQYVEEWHRARVTSILSANEVEVYFYDYGTRRVVPKENIHYLQTAHSALPAQAIRAVLANIAPVSDKWTPEASKRFLQLIANKALIGIVTSVDTINKLFSLFLCDTTGEDDIYIHEVLISEGYAVETGTECNEKEFTRIEINDLKTEEQSNENLIKMEESEEKQHNMSCGSLHGCSKLPPVLSSTRPDKTTLHLDTAQDLQSQNSSRKSSQSSLLRKDSLNCSPSVSKSIFFGGSSVSSDASSTVVTTAENKSLAQCQQSAPPPGFSCTIKCETESDASDKTESHTLSVGRNTQKRQSETDLETPKIHPSHDVKSEIKDGHKDTAYEASDHSENVKGVSSGVNADFSNPKAPYLPNYYTYPNWFTVPQTYPNLPVMSSFPSVNALAPLPLAPLPLPTIPNALNFYHMWHCEQYQQAFLQGMLAHQQMTTSTFPPGLYLPQSYSTVSPRNHMNISEVHSPDHSRGVKSNLNKNNSTCQEECINSATQTEVGSSGESSDIQLKLEMGVSSLEKVSDLIMSSDFQAFTNEDGTSLLRKCPGSGIHESVDIDGDTPNAELYTASAVEASSEEVITVDIVKNSVSCSLLPANDPINQTIDMCKNDLGPSSQCSVLGDLTPKSFSPLHEDNIDCTSVDEHIPPSRNDCRRKIEKVHESDNLEQESTKVSDVQNSCVDRSILERDNFEVQYHNVKTPSHNVLNSQRKCNIKSGVKEIVHQVDRPLHNIHHIEESDTMKIKGDWETLHIVNTDSVVESGQMDVDEQEIAQECAVTPCVDEIDLYEDDYHEHEMIEKAQEEYVTKTITKSNKVTILTDKISTEKEASVLTRENLNMMNEEETSSEVSSGIQSSICDKYSFESREKRKFEKGETCGLDKFESTTDHVSKQESLLTVPQANSSRNSEIPSLLHGSYKVSQKSCSLSEKLSLKFEALSVTDEHQDSMYSREFIEQDNTYRGQPNVKVQKPELHNNMSKENERIVSSVSKVQTNLSKQVQPVIRPKLSSEVSASFISGPTQPAMSQNTSGPLPTRGHDQSKDDMLCDKQLSCPVLIGKTTWTKDGVCKTNLQRHKENSSGKHMIRQQFVKKIYLRGKKIHLINLDGRPYVISDEIVDYFTHFNGRHVIIKILEARKIEISFLEMTRKRRPDLFECLDKSDIACRGLNRGPTGNVIGGIHLVPLRSVPYMLRALHKDDEALSMDVKEEVDKFDDNDPYWMGKCD